MTQQINQYFASTNIKFTRF